MSKLWEGRLSGEPSKLAEDFNASVSFDKRLYKQDISGSASHALMLSKQGIISESEADDIIGGLSGILDDLDSGRLEIDMGSEDIHTFIEVELTKRVGDAGKKLHTARSRNDQAALDLRLYVRDETGEILKGIKALMRALLKKAGEHLNTVMPGYTHLRRAQPVTFAHHLTAYAAMLRRDCDRFEDTLRRTNVSPLGSGALAGTTYDIDRFFTSSSLGFSRPCDNSMDGVSDRDFCLDFLYSSAVLASHLSRFAEELIYWSGLEFGFITISDDFSTGSSIMPQKKNPDIPELIRGKTGRVYGNLMGLLTVVKGLPLAYNKDLQEDKEFVFDSADTVKNCLLVMAPLVESMSVNKEKMKKAGEEGFLGATDCADYLAKKGMPFRDAYKTAGRIVAFCDRSNQTLDSLPLEKYREFSALFGEDIYDAVSLENCVSRRVSYGGPSPGGVAEQIKIFSSFLEKSEN
ncbi:MAG: argininosuccinate lyase [Eubacteriales bacterium]